MADAERDIAMSAAVAPQPPATGELAPGVVTILSSRVRRIVAPNPTLMTGPGTGTYLIGTTDVAVLDPGPDTAEHLDRIIEAGGGAIRWVIYTHTHLDHSPGVAPLVQRTGATSAGFAPRPSTEDPVADVEVRDGWQLFLSGVTLTALHTPGHASNHVCWLLEEERMLFSGDHIMNGSTVVIAPPDGDMDAYLTQLERLRALGLASIAPGHGALITDPIAKIDEYLTHRREREGQIATELDARGSATIAELVEAIYVDTPAALHPVARFSVWAHLRRLAASGRASTADPDDQSGIWVTQAGG